MWWVPWFIALAVFTLAIHLWQARRTAKKLSEMQTESEQIRSMDEKIFRLYQEIESMLDNFEEYVSEVHEEQEFRRKELLEMSRQATTLYMQVMQPSVYTGLRPPLPDSAEPLPELQKAHGYETPETYKPVSQGDKKAEDLRSQVKASKLASRDRLELDRLSTKGQKVRYLMSRGFTIDDVARELELGKGEIKLIVDLEKD